MAGSMRARVSSSSWIVWWALALAGLVAAAVLLLVLVPPAAVPERFGSVERHRLAAMAAVRTTIVQCIAGFVVLVGVVFTARSVHVSRETHLTDRLAKAVDQLGSDEPVVRLGGIHHLQRLADNSPLDRELVSDVLTGYLRVRAGTPRSTPVPVPPDVQTALSVLVKLQS